MTDSRRQIIAIGGGADVLMNAEHPALDHYILQQARSPRPSIGFVPTAGGDDSSRLAMFYTAFAQYDCKPSHLPFFGRTPDLRAYILEQDVVLIGGGNTRSMLAVWREWGLDDVLREAWEQGVVLAGSSAGAICWFDEGVTDSSAQGLTVLSCLGMLAGSCCPHYDGESERRPTYHRLVLGGEISPGLAIDDGTAVHFVGDEIHRVVSAKEGAGAYRVSVEDASVREDGLKVQGL